MTVGERIKQERNKAGMTMEALGAALGVGRSAINKWEKGTVERISREKILKMARIFGCDPAWLGGYKNESLDTEENRQKVEVANEVSKTVKYSPEEEQLILKYRKASAEDKKMFNRILDNAIKN